MKKFLLLTMLAGIAVAGEVRYDCLRFVEAGLANDPQIAEARFGTESKKEKIQSLKAEAILPTLDVSMMVGPAPGLKESVDNWGDTVDVYDFSKMGPFWGVQAKFVQPLNLGQYRSGKRALEADVQQKSFAIENALLRKEVELQTYYYNYLLALEMKRLAADAQKRVDEAYEQMEEALDDDDPNVSQMDFLNLKAKMHTVKEGVTEAELGMKRVQLAIRFSLNLQDGDVFAAEDTVLVPRKEKLPLLEEVRLLTLQSNPELKQLSAGLIAKRTQMDLAEAKLAPEFFVLGEVEYVKRAGYREARVEYRGLKMKEAYAADGLMAKAEEQYYQVVAAQEKMDALKESLKASEAILKGAAMQYDLDKSKTGELVSAYTQNVTLQKDYLFAVCKYNVEVAELIARMGLSLKDYQARF